MKVYQGIEPFDPPAEGVVLTIGNFDGVHRGHRRLLEAARRQARDANVTAVAVTFEPHPLAILAPQKAPARLSTIRERIALIEMSGIDAVIVLQSNRRLLGRTAEQFLSDLVENCRPRAIVEGPTFRFGRGREGSVETLCAYAAGLGFSVTVVDELHSDGLDDHPAINSSAIRQALREGRLSDANTLLGRPYRIAGVVGRGRRRGQALGFPTANLAQIPHLLPAEAVYAAVAQRADDQLHLAAVNIGPQPTFAQGEVCVEAHLLDFSGELDGQCLGLHLLAKLRGQLRFGGGDELVAQLHRDVGQTRACADQLARMRSEPRVPL